MSKSFSLVILALLRTLSAKEAGGLHFVIFHRTTARLAELARTAKPGMFEPAPAQRREDVRIVAWSGENLEKIALRKLRRRENMEFGSREVDLGPGMVKTEPVMVKPEPEPGVVKPEPEPGVVKLEPEPGVVKPAPEGLKPEPVVVELEPEIVDARGDFGLEVGDTDFVSFDLFSCPRG